MIRDLLDLLEGALYWLVGFVGTIVLVEVIRRVI